MPRMTVDLSTAERKLLYDWSDRFNGAPATEVTRAMYRYFAERPGELGEVETILRAMSRERREARTGPVSGTGRAEPTKQRPKRT